MRTILIYHISKTQDDVTIKQTYINNNLNIFTLLLYNKKIKIVCMVLKPYVV